MTERVLGVDACKAGWVGVVLAGATIAAYVAPAIADLVAQAESEGEAAGPLDVIGIDIPIGLAEHGRRRCDLLAREAAGPRRSSVFVTPVRAALARDDFTSAVALNRQRTGVGFSIQAYGLKAKILDVDAFVHGSTRRVVEVHPELSFAAMAGAPLADAKTTWAGMQCRRRLLLKEGVDVDADLGTAGRRAGVDDLLDAAAVAWTARRVARGRAISRPDPPEIVDDGWPATIWT